MKHVLVLLGCLSAASVQAASVALVETNGVTLAKVTIRTSPASTVRTLVALPPKDKWDGRLWFYGNGGPAGGLDAKGVLAQAACGRIGVHTDMGTHNPPEKLHHETIVDFGHRATHLSLLEAKRLARERYGRNPDYCYFEGQSTGGGQGIHAALRYPEDFDGIMSGVPANVRMPLHVYFWWARRELRKDGKPVFSNDELKAVQSAAKEVLGAKDPEWCRGKFLLDITWTQERAEAVLKRAAEMMPTLQDADKQARLQRLLKGPELGGKPVHTGLPFGSLLTNFEGLQFVLRWYVGEHADLDAVDETTIRRWVAAYSPHLDATSPDLDGFRARGGKLIVYAGLEDPIVPCPPIVDWYRSVDRGGCVYAVLSASRTRAWRRIGDCRSERTKRGADPVGGERRRAGDAGGSAQRGRHASDRTASLRRTPRGGRTRLARRAGAGFPCTEGRISDCRPFARREVPRFDVRRPRVCGARLREIQDRPHFGGKGGATDVEARVGLQSGIPGELRRADRRAGAPRTGRGGADADAADV